MMVIAKPIDVTNVSAVPFLLASAVCETNAENCGESAITNEPQINNASKKRLGGSVKNNGDSKQQTIDPDKEKNATFALPSFAEK